MKSLQQVPRNTPVVVDRVGGPRSYRRRLMEMGLLPGTELSIVNVAPFGDPLEIEVRGCRLSIRRHEAALVLVRQ